MQRKHKAKVVSWLRRRWKKHRQRQWLSHKGSGKHKGNSGALPRSIPPSRAGLHPFGPAMRSICWRPFTAALLKRLPTCEQGGEGGSHAADGSMSALAQKL